MLLIGGVWRSSAVPKTPRDSTETEKTTDSATESTEEISREYRGTSKCCRSALAVEYVRCEKTVTCIPDDIDMHIVVVVIIIVIITYTMAQQHSVQQSPTGNALDWTKKAKKHLQSVDKVEM